MTAEPDEVCAFSIGLLLLCRTPRSFDLAETARRVVHDLLAASSHLIQQLGADAAAVTVNQSCR